MLHYTLHPAHVRSFPQSYVYEVTNDKTIGTESTPGGDTVVCLAVRITKESGSIETERVPVTSTTTFTEVVQFLVDDHAHEYRLRTTNTTDGMALMGNVTQICEQHFPGEVEVTVYLRKKS